MKLNLRLVAVIFVVFLVVFLGNAIIGMGESLPRAEQAPLEISKRDLLGDFDENGQKERIEQISTLANQIENMLERLIEKGFYFPYKLYCWQYSFSYLKSRENNVLYLKMGADYCHPMNVYFRFKIYCPFSAPNIKNRLFTHH